jgi:hypothetical protein
VKILKGGDLNHKPVCLPAEVEAVEEVEEVEEVEGVEEVKPKPQTVRSTNQTPPKAVDPKHREA